MYLFFLRYLHNHLILVDHEKVQLKYTKGNITGSVTLGCVRCITVSALKR